MIWGRGKEWGTRLGNYNNEREDGNGDRVDRERVFRILWYGVSCIA
jgi:hypothetical protein